jgi:hypothetical protein
MRGLDPFALEGGVTPNAGQRTVWPVLLAACNPGRPVPQFPGERVLRHQQ